MPNVQTCFRLRRSTDRRQPPASLCWRAPPPEHHKARNYHRGSGDALRGQVLPQYKDGKRKPGDDRARGLDHAAMSKRHKHKTGVGQERKRRAAGERQQDDPASPADAVEVGGCRRAKRAAGARCRPRSGGPSGPRASARHRCRGARRRSRTPRTGPRPRRRARPRTPGDHRLDPGRSPGAVTTFLLGRRSRRRTTWLPVPCRPVSVHLRGMLPAMRRARPAASPACGGGSGRG